MTTKKRSAPEQTSGESETPQGADVLARPAIEQKPTLPREVNGPKGLEPTRYGDWESKGRCHDF
ncbi:MAG: DUF1674 domain-containing protein [Arenicella sp.]|nr:DUF1674 domain-containing protein [Arenicella sp.]